MYKETDKRTKLVATIGPSSDNYEMLKKISSSRCNLRES